GTLPPPAPPPGPASRSHAASENVATSRSVIDAGEVELEQRRVQDQHTRHLRPRESAAHRAGGGGPDDDGAPGRMRLEERWLVFHRVEYERLVDGYRRIALDGDRRDPAPRGPE